VALNLTKDGEVGEHRVKEKFPTHRLDVWN
jgi:hypothetical protein